MNLSQLYSDLKVKYDNLKSQVIRQNKTIAEQNILISELQKEVAANKKGIISVGDDIYLIEKARIPQGYGLYVSLKKYTGLYKILNP